MIHVDTKQLACFERVGHRITGDRRIGSSRGAGYEKAHVAIDHATRLSYVEVLPDENQATTVGFQLRAVAWFDDLGITCKRVLSDNGSAYRSKPWRVAFSALGLTSIWGNPTDQAYTPRTNGTAERFIKPLLAEWACSMAFQISGEWNRWLPRYLVINNGRRCHMALSGRIPIQQLGLLRANE